MSFRKERIADLIMSSLGMLIRQLHDPRFKEITLTEVRMSPDLKTAKIYFSAMNLNSKEAEKALRGATPVFKKQLADDLKLRFIPRLQYFFDQSLEHGNRIDALLKSVKDQE